MSDSIWASKTVTELKIELMNRELPTSGKKDALVERLIASDLDTLHIRHVHGRTQVIRIDCAKSTLADLKSILQDPHTIFRPVTDDAVAKTGDMKILSEPTSWRAITGDETLHEQGIFDGHTLLMA